MQALPLPRRPFPSHDVAAAVAWLRSPQNRSFGTPRTPEHPRSRPLTLNHLEALRSQILAVTTMNSRSFDHCLSWACEEGIGAESYQARVTSTMKSYVVYKATELLLEESSAVWKDEMKQWLLEALAVYIRRAIAQWKKETRDKKRKRINTPNDTPGPPSTPRSFRARSSTFSSPSGTSYSDPASSEEIGLALMDISAHTATETQRNAVQQLVMELGADSQILNVQRIVRDAVLASSPLDCNAVYRACVEYLQPIVGTSNLWMYAGQAIAKVQDHIRDELLWKLTVRSSYEDKLRAIGVIIDIVSFVLGATGEWRVELCCGSFPSELAKILTELGMKLSEEDLDRFEATGSKQNIAPTIIKFIETEAGPWRQLDDFLAVVSRTG